MGDTSYDTCADERIMLEKCCVMTWSGIQCLRIGSNGDFLYIIMVILFQQNVNLSWAHEWLYNNVFPHLLIHAARVCWRSGWYVVPDKFDALLQRDRRIPARVSDFHTKRHVGQYHGIVINTIDRLESHFDPLDAVHLPHFTTLQSIARSLLLRLVMYWEQSSNDEVAFQKSRDSFLFLLRLWQHWRITVYVTSV